MSVKGGWLKVKEDFDDGDTLTIKDEGQEVEGTFGLQTVFAVASANKEGNLALNQTSQNNLVDAFGEDTEKWVGKRVKVFVIKQRVGDGLKNVVYLAGEGYTMTDDGAFVNTNEEDIPVINTEDVPF